MPIAIILVALVIVGGVIAVALGHGGELARDASDEPDRGDFESSTDVATYRPPAALLGYHAGATEHALQLIARTIADRDAEISWLRGRLRELQPEGERREGALRGLPDPAGPVPAGQVPSGPHLTGPDLTGPAQNGPVQGSAATQDTDPQRSTVPSGSPVALGSTAQTGDER